MDRTGTAVGTGCFPTAEGSSLKLWRVEKVVTLNHKLNLIHLCIKMLKLSHLIVNIILHTH